MKARTYCNQHSTSIPVLAWHHGVVARGRSPDNGFHDVGMATSLGSEVKVIEAIKEEWSCTDGGYSSLFAEIDAMLNSIGDRSVCKGASNRGVLLWAAWRAKS